MPTSSLSEAGAPAALKMLALVIVLAPFAAAVCAFAFRKYPRLINGITLGFSLVSLVASMAAASWVVERGYPVQFPYFSLYLDALSIYFVLLVNLVALFASYYSIQFLEFDRDHNKHHSPALFHFFLNMFHMTMLLVPMVDNLVVLWISIELTTVFSTILVRYRRDRLSLEAAWKFIMITTTGIIFALLGTLFMANSVPLKLLNNEAIGPMNWSFLVSQGIPAVLNDDYVRLSFLFILLGYGTKAGLAPMHTWLPDGHGQAPAPVSALLSGVMLKSALYAILRFYTITNLSLDDQAEFTSNLLMAAGLLSLVLATPFILKRNRFKRVLAYHSLEHMGIITFGIGIGTQVALFAALLHALNHALTKALMFLVHGSIQYEYINRCGAEYGEGGEESRIQGVLKAMPVSGTLLAFGGLALVGSPPFNIFMSEFMILWAAVQEAGLRGDLRSWLAVLLFILTVTLIFAGLVGHLSRILLGTAPFKPVEPSLRCVRTVFPFVVLIAIITLFGLLLPGWPVDFPAILAKSAQIVQGGASGATAVRLP